MFEVAFAFSAFARWLAWREDLRKRRRFANAFDQQRSDRRLIAVVDEIFAGYVVDGGGCRCCL
jgi:hypothetical protein